MAHLEDRLPSLEARIRRHNDRLFSFEAVTGIFEQSLPETDASTFDYTKNCMGLISRSRLPSDDVPEKPWARLMQYIERLQAAAPEGTYYKLIINGRHGQGYHNVAEDEYGTALWESTIARREEYHDAHLTSLGERQALTAKAFLEDQMANQGLPAPQSYLVSPLHRCLQTAYLTYSGIDLPADRPFRPVVREMLRERMGVHTNDRRSTRGIIQELWPEVEIEEGFAEEDLLWQRDHRETHQEHNLRMQALLDDLFEHDPSVVVSFTSHTGAINCLLRVLRHRPFRLKTGAIIPLLVKGTRVRQRERS